jgi:hypothetical protein
MGKNESFLCADLKPKLYFWVGQRGVVLLWEKKAEDKDSCIINPTIER